MRLIDADKIVYSWTIDRDGQGHDGVTLQSIIDKMPTVEIEPCEEKLAKCRFEYINACKIVTYPNPDIRQSDIHDAYAVIKALQPIFGYEEF